MTDIRTARAGLGAGISRGALAIAGLMLAGTPALAQTAAAPAAETPQETGGGAGETEEVVHAMACHHGDYDPETVEAVLVTAADALSAARPGARREILETYVKRLKQLEEIASSFKGVQKTFAIQAGREIRIIVDSEKISDEESIWLSRDIARRLEAELTYPGQIKVTVIRETRAVEFAR